MATIISHAIAAVSVGYALPLPGIKKDARFYSAAGLCAVLPDADVLGFLVGIRYEDFWGHRGFTHSFVFAVVTGLLMAAALQYNPLTKAGAALAGFLAFCTSSHGLLDAFTNGGLGVALFSPFYDGRIFFPATPIQVSPIGGAFFSQAGLHVLASEAIWIGIPCIWILMLGFVRRKFWRTSLPSS